jgi:hypothetical protein
MLASLGRPSPDTRIGQPAVCGRATIFEPAAQPLHAISPEEERLGDVYRKKGLKALIEELQTF